MHLPSARELLHEMWECGKKADVLGYMFLGFGTMLGAIRGNALIPHDDDMDICFLPMTADKKERYYKACLEAGLFDGWKNPKERMVCKPNGELLWFSTKKTEKGTKSCNWFFINWEDCLWHTKGKLWVSDIHFDPKLKYKKDDEGIMLGAPKSHFKQISLVNFEGKPWGIPKKAGELCDLYYPNWFFPQEGGSSAQDRIARIGKWDDERTWQNLK